MIYDYTLNFNYLSQWMEANPKYSKRQVLKAIGSSDYECFNRWLNGELPMPINILLKFCNTFGVPLSNFFCDKNAPASFTVPAPTESDSTDPSGGYPDYGHRHGRQNTNPQAEQHLESNLPSSSEKPFAFPPSLETKGDESIAIETLKLTMAHREELLYERHKTEIVSLQREWAQKEISLRKELEKGFYAERMRYLDVIANLTQKIADLSLYSSSPLDCGMAAEGEGEMK